MDFFENSFVRFALGFIAIVLISVTLLISLNLYGG